MKEYWKLEHKINILNYFLEKNIPEGCKSEIIKQLKYYINEKENY